MPAKTKAHWKAALDHIITVVLAQDPADDTIIKDALASYGVTGPLDLMTVSPDDLATIVYKDANGVEQPFPKFKQGLVNCFRFYHDWRIHEGNPVGDDEWLQLTE